MSTLDLGVIGNCAIASLIDRNGRHVWHGLGRLDGDPVFNALLGGNDPQSGFMDVVVAGAKDSASATCPTPPSSKPRSMARAAPCASSTSRRASAASAACSVRPCWCAGSSRSPAGRGSRCACGRPSTTARDARRSPAGSNHVRFFGDAAVLRLTTDASINYVLHETEFSLDRPLTLIVGADESITDNPDTMARTFLAETEAYWQTWVRDLNIPFDWQDAVIRAAITLKLCSFEDTGAVLAALTTSVPEAPGTPRTWDYRFSWLRDAFFTVTALNRLSATRTMEGYRALHHRHRRGRQLARRGP